MFLLVASMKFGVVGFALAKHAKENFEQALSQAAQGTGVAFALLAFLAVVSFSPGAHFPKRVGPQMHGVTHKFVAGPPHFGSVDAAGLKTDRGGPGKTLQHLESAVAGGIPDRSQPGVEEPACL